jgi:hypothetical protein
VVVVAVAAAAVVVVVVVRSMCFVAHCLREWMITMTMIVVMMAMKKFAYESHNLVRVVH